MAAKASTKKEAFSRVLIDDQLRAAGWQVTDGTSVRYEYPLSDGTCCIFGREQKVLPRSLHTPTPSGASFSAHQNLQD